MKKNKKTLLKLKLVRISKLNALALTGGEGQKTYTKSWIGACLSYLDRDQICNL